MYDCTHAVLRASICKSNHVLLSNFALLNDVDDAQHYCMYIIVVGVLLLCACATVACVYDDDDDGVGQRMLTCCWYYNFIFERVARFDTRQWHTRVSPTPADAYAKTHHHRSRHITLSLASTRTWIARLRTRGNTFAHRTHRTSRTRESRELRAHMTHIPIMLSEVSYAWIVFSFVTITRGDVDLDYWHVNSEHVRYVVVL